jgi:hypothetical protein
MPEEHVNKKKNDSQQDVGDAADNSEINMDESGNIPKPGPRGIAKKMRETQN